MSTRIIAGIAGAVLAGLVLGVMMQMMGLMTDLSDMVGMESVAVGWVIHLMMSVLFGLVYGLLLMAASLKLGANLGLGAAYGIAIWIMGPLIIMPMMMGDAVLAFDTDTMMMLMGHVMWGLLTGAIAVAVHRRLATSDSISSSRQPV